MTGNAVTGEAVTEEAWASWSAEDVKSTSSGGGELSTMVLWMFSLDADADLGFSNTYERAGYQRKAVNSYLKRLSQSDLPIPSYSPMIDAITSFGSSGVTAHGGKFNRKGRVSFLPSIFLLLRA